MDSNKIVSILIFLISFGITVFDESHARTLDSGSPMSSPSPSPFPSPAPGPSNEGCWHRLESCRNGSLTACVDPSSGGSKELLLVMKNDGETALKVNVTMSHAKPIKEIPVPQHQIKEVNISANVGGNSSIRLEAVNLECVIRIVSSASGGGGSFFGYIPLPSPINGAYFLFVTGVIVVCCAWAYCKRGQRGQRGDGIAYKELEMEQPHSPHSASNVETADGWEQDWDGDWDELKSKAATRRTSRAPKREGRDNTRDD